jgi:RNA polymerase sigma-B factor
VESSRQVSDELLRERLIASHLPLVHSIARRHLGRGEELEDLVQVGAIGLVKASDRFDPSRGVGFAAFAAPAIEGEIRNHLRDRTPPVRIPREQERIRGELRRRRDELAARLGRTPTVGELAEALSVDEGDIERALTAERARAAVSISSEDETQLPAESEALAISDDRLVLASGVRSLDERERRIVFLRFHADMTERQIARELGISQAHVSRLLSGALIKLRKELGRTGVNGTDGDITSDTVKLGGERIGTKISDVDEPDSREIPAPGQEPADSSAGHSYSGRFLVRMPKPLHEQLARAAEQEQVSLNRFVTDVLTAAVAEGDVGKPLATTRKDGPDPVVGSHRVLMVGTQRVSARSFRLALATNLVVVILAGAVAVVLLVLALQRGI